jgi:hypothetical protein
MCPKCGSRDTARIIWDEPYYSFKLNSELDKGTVFFGGCCIPIPEPTYHCNQCNDDFAYRRTKPGIYSCDMISTGIIKNFTVVLEAILVAIMFVALIFKNMV